MSTDEQRLEFVYREAVRGLEVQRDTLESLLSRAGMLIFATSLASSTLGSQAMSDGLGAWDWVAVGFLVLVGVLVAVMLWPYYQYRFRFEPKTLLERYVDSAEPVSTAAMYRELALEISADGVDNGRIIARIRVACQLALIALLIEILAWLAAIA